ncbi:ABC transporter permease subunit [Syntrophotalea acetylenica]|uniref:ABC transporter permease n=1 Tax=Syntrophotalea acetylenica TaxID=29542 RepID=A0A1L3GHH8_SYNAC|nr:ABC transporter permease subunit [Syntrophotalea acetylenica]APG25402.1 hypothetical protein A7E75_10505 [Syntrophotalea acetylenica]APG43469.1 hypothetical protein A6070_04510 [Syntrophotalea acetylenica]
MGRFAWTTMLGFWRDRLFLGLLALSVALSLAPVVGMLSMRQVTELTMTLCLSLSSLLLLLLAVFGGTTVLWRDFERRYAQSVLTLPVRRWQVLLGKFLGVALFLAGVALALALVSAGCILFATSIYPPDRPVVWGLFVAAMVFDTLKYILLAAIGVLFSSVSTNLFLPIFGTVILYLVGTATQDVYEYLSGPLAETVTPAVGHIVRFLYYFLPNLKAFDLKLNAIYGLAFTPFEGVMVMGYFIGYISVVLGLALVAFNRREFL